MVQNCWLPGFLAAANYENVLEVQNFYVHLGIGPLESVLALGPCISLQHACC